ncbi:MAG TPA: nucleoside monophosphate kinase [Myxococcota bacterium]|nr:nucleoside monophosphate kinase [Myxococcota bacterium]
MNKQFVHFRAVLYLVGAFGLFASAAFTELVVVIVGPPGSGKGTQTTMLRDKLDWLLISPSGILREEKLKNTDLGQIRTDYRYNQDIKDRMKLAALTDKMAQEPGMKPAKGFIVDSWPKSPNGIRFAMGSVFRERDILVVELTVDDNTLIARALKRKLCTKASCGLSYGEHYTEKDKGYCDFCQSPLWQRPKDNPTDFPNRIDKYRKNVEVMKRKYKDYGIDVQSIDGSRNKNEVHEDILKIVNKHAAGI